ncbi:tetratricopeptide repeat protein, partial [Klebsiella pneumoniae]
MKKSPSSAKKKLCFVIMGFGKKTDYKSGKTLNLDATYYEIIKPAAEECGIE